jgi:parvulin-like peptidyl-prolyl isomerase
MAQPMLRLFGHAAVVAAFALTACGGSHKDEPSPKAASAPASESAASAPAPQETAAVPVPSHAPEPLAGQAAPGSTSPGRPPAHHVVATVNGKPIPEEKVYALYRMNRTMLQQRGRALTDNDEQVLRAQSLQIAVADELFYQDAMKKGVKVGRGEVDEAVKQLKTRVGTPEAYEKFLKESGFAEIDVRKELERNLQTEAYRKTLFAGKNVSDEQVRKFYDENAPKGMFNVPEQVHVQYIVLKGGDKDPESVKSEARKHAAEAAKRAAAGEDFAALAKQYSQDQTAERGGDIGFVPRGVMFPKFDEIAFSLKPGDVSPSFETPRGFGVMKVLEKKAPSKRTFDEVKEELKSDMGRLMQQDALKAKANELAAGAKINVLDAAYLIPPSPSPTVQSAPPVKPAKP